MTKSQETPVILISPETRTALTAEVDRAGATGELVGGLLFGHPVDEHQRLVVGSVRLSSDVGFGRRDFALDQTRTSRQLESAQGVDAEATYCGVWYLHRTPNRELTAEEWEQARAMLEDPDFGYGDLVCLVLCFYHGELEIFASSFNRHHSTRGQAPAPAELRLTTDRLASMAPSECSSNGRSDTDWYKTSEVTARLIRENQRLAKEYHVESALTPDRQLFFRLSPKRRYQKMSFYLAIRDGFPDTAPHVFLLVGGKSRQVSVPSLGSWSASSWLADVADELVDWLAFSIGEYMTAAEAAFRHRKYSEAADLVTLVLAIAPRTPGASRLLARATRI